MKILLPALLAALLAPALPAQNAIHVPGDVSTIGGAVAAAASGDTILVAPGSYPETNIDLAGKALRIASTGGAAVTIVDATQSGAGFLFLSGEDSRTVLEGFTIERGRPGVYVRSSSPTIRDCVVASCHGTTFGGGMQIEDGSPLVEGCTFRGCSALAHGGGAYLIRSSATIRGCLFEGNRAGPGCNGPAPGWSGCRGADGGGLYLEDSNARIESCRFVNNRAGDGGSGATGAAGANGTLLSTPKNGYGGGHGGAGGKGGAIFVQDGSPLILNVYAFGNSTGRGGRGGNGGKGGDGISFQDGADGGRGGNGGSGGRGGAIFFARSRSTSEPDLAHLTIATNVYDSGGSAGIGGAGGSGGFGASSGSRGSSGTTGASGATGGLEANTSLGLTVWNSIFWGNLGDQLWPRTMGFLWYSTVQGGFPSGTPILSSNPMLSGPDLLPGSPAIDAGYDPWNFGSFETDLHGRARRFDHPLLASRYAGSIVDMGCTEFVAPFLLPISCAPVGNVLASGTPRPGETLRFEVVPDAACAGPRASLLEAGLLVGALGSAACGTPTAGGSLRLDPGRPLKLRWGTGPGAGVFELVLPGDPALVGYSFGVQGLSVAPRQVVPSPGCPSSGWTLLDAYRVIVGP